MGQWIRKGQLGRKGKEGSCASSPLSCERSTAVQHERWLPAGVRGALRLWRQQRRLRRQQRRLRRRRPFRRERARRVRRRRRRGWWFVRRGRRRRHSDAAPAGRLRRVVVARAARERNAPCGVHDGTRGERRWWFDGWFFGRAVGRHPEWRGARAVGPARHGALHRRGPRRVTHQDPVFAVMVRRASSPRFTRARANEHASSLAPPPFASLHRPSPSCGRGKREISRKLRQTPNGGRVVTPTECLSPRFFFLHSVRVMAAMIVDDAATRMRRRGGRACVTSSPSSRRRSAGGASPCASRARRLAKTSAAATPRRPWRP